VAARTDQKPLTDKTIKALKGAAEQKINTKTGKPYWPQPFRPDGDVPGFGVRVSGAPDALVKTFSLQYRFQGQQRKLQIGRYPAMGLHEARKRAWAALGDVHRGIDPAAKRDEERSAGTFKDLASMYVTKYAREKKRTWHEDERMIQSTTSSSDFPQDAPRERIRSRCSSGRVSPERFSASTNDASSSET